MVYLHSSISVCKSTHMVSSLNSTGKSRTRKASSASNRPETQPYHGSRWAAIDIIILIAVITACVFLLYPYAKAIFDSLSGIIGTIAYTVKEEIEEIDDEPLIYGCIGIGFSCSALAAFLLVVCLFGSKCGDPKCKGLRKAAEFDIQLETEDSLKNSGSAKERLRKGLFELPRDRHRELEAELEKIAPPNGRAVLLLRARCGCSVGKLVVPGPRRLRKKKK